MRNLHIFIFGLLLVGGLTSCNKEDLGPTDADIFQADKDNILSYATTKGLSGTMTANGVYIALTTPNSSTSSTATPTNGTEAEFNYTLYALSSNTGGVVTDKFVDSTYMTKSSFSYIVATNPGLTEGLLRMREGDKAMVLLPSIYGFGRTGTTNGVVPPNTPIRLDITLKRVRTQDQQINEYMTANKLTPTEITSSGLRFIRTVTNSTGASPTSTQTLVMKYTGKLLRSASAFDSTGTGTYPTTIGKNVPGFDEGIAKLKVGEKATIIFPSTLGYGADGRQVIPPYAPLRFDIELVSVQ